MAATVMSHPLPNKTLVRFAVPGEDEGDYGPRWCPPGSIGEITCFDPDDGNYDVVFQPSGVWNRITAEEFVEDGAEIVGPASPEAQRALAMGVFAQAAGDILYQGKTDTLDADVFESASLFETFLAGLKEGAALGLVKAKSLEVVSIRPALAEQILGAAPEDLRPQVLAIFDQDMRTMKRISHLLTGNPADVVMTTTTADRLMALSGFGERFNYATAEQVAGGLKDSLEQAVFSDADVALLASMAGPGSTPDLNGLCGDKKLLKALTKLRNSLRPQATGRWTGDGKVLVQVRDRAEALGLIPTDQAPAP